jgi:23S rRNA (uracil1939-C5)-methyltransferase
VNRVRIRAIAAGGDGVGTLESGKTVFVPGTAVGDTAIVEVVVERARWARGRVTQIAEPSPDRIDPMCEHYLGDDCGGCQLQHLSADAQHAAKQRIVGDALRRIAGFQAMADPPIVPAPDPWRYRTRITLAARDGRIGFHRRAAPGEVFDLGDCRLASSRIMDLWSRVSAHRDLLPSEIRSLILREDPQGGRHAIVETAEHATWDGAPLAAAVDAADVTYWWKPRGGDARAAGGAASDFPVTAFEQVQPEFGQRIRSAAVEALGDVRGRVVWDLYAGVGETAARLAALGAVVHAVEVDGAAVAAGRLRAECANDGTITWHHGRVEVVVGALPMPQAVIVNPPRTGLAAQAAEALGRWADCTPGGKLVYVSCDPATLARDLKRVPRLQPRAVTAFDLFPQTAHVETVVALEAA